MNICIVIPVYQHTLSKPEQLSLRLAEKYLSDFDWVVVAPTSIISSPSIQIIRKKTEVFFCSDAFFQNTNTYSKLLLTTSFYRRFQKYSHILIYQLDALVQRSGLEEFVHSDFSYIGAPWPLSLSAFLTHPQGVFRNVVGNGGVSLRNVEDHLRVLKHFEKQPDTHIKNSWATFFQAIASGKSRGRWLQHPSEYPLNEDGFWSLEAPKYYEDFTIAPLEIARRFSYEKGAVHEKKPMFIHAWKKYGLKNSIYAHLTRQ